MISKERWEQINQMVAAGRSISAIARELDLDRKTVRHGLRKQQWAPYRRKLAVPTLLAPHQAWLKERAPQVNYSARILFRELEQKGYHGSYDTVKLAGGRCAAKPCWLPGAVHDLGLIASPTRAHAVGEGRQAKVLHHTASTDH
ncbi:transposase [Pseudoduganella namucuonensis]|uniref:transposase n=1 Tax=Pseudoduganella namucuonensis TaxID=1035707 RepID=UPI0015A6EA69|nr:transposase [Pseudoduganella namucuonensis]